MSSREEKAIKLTKKIEKEEKHKKNKKRGKLLLKILLFLTILVAVVFYYMRYIEPHMLLVKEIKVASTTLPDDFNGFKIVHISDIHYKMTTEKKDLEKIVKSINKLKPDIVVITGDLLDSNIQLTNDDIKDLIECLKNINVTMNKYYIKGNHDYYTDLTDIYKESDFKSLNNTSDLIYINDSYISINGYGSSIQNDFITNDIQDSNYKIALIHEPDNISKLIDYDYNLILAGHSHNLQINLPFIKELFTVEGCKKYYKNYYKINNTDLYINSGIGTSKYRLRLFNPPTINFYRLMTK